MASLVAAAAIIWALLATTQRHQHFVPLPTGPMPTALMAANGTDADGPYPLRSLQVPAILGAV